MLKNSKAKGSRRERQSRDVLVRGGAIVVKAGGSLGPVDLIAWWPGKRVMAVQVKSNRRPGKEEMQQLIDLAARCGGSRDCVAVHIWRDRKGLSVEVV